MSQQEYDIAIMLAVCTIFTLLLSAFFVVLVYRYQNRLRNKQQELFRSVMQAQEEERKRVAMDIHDGLGGLLSTGKLLLGEIREGNLDVEQIESHVDSVYDLIIKAIREARNASHALLPDSIKRFGLRGAINELKEKYSLHFNINLRNDCPENVPELLEINIYRLINEMMHNAAKHSGSKEVDLEIGQRKNTLLVSFNDNGKGFNFRKSLEEHKGSGLRNIESRVKLLNGNIEFTHDKGAGYKIEFDLNSYV